jgi:hypothetical protein
MQAEAELNLRLYRSYSEIPETMTNYLEPVSYWPEADLGVE